MRHWLNILALLAMLTHLAACDTAPATRAQLHYPPALAERVALVIGNSRYTSFNPLDGSREDAATVATALREQGFTLIGGGPLYDLDWAEMVQHMRVFEARMSAGGVAVFYHSGHAVQVNGDNFLIPVDAGDWTVETIDTELVRLAGSFRPPADREPRIKLILLDRTLPGPLIGSPGAILESHLAEEHLDHNEIHIFASAPGSRIEQAEALLSGLGEPVADTPVGPSPLSQAFADALRTSYAHILQIAYQLNVMVADQTNDHQHLLTRYGDEIPTAGPLVGIEGASSLLSRIDEAERSLLVRPTPEQAQFRSSIAQMVGRETRSTRAVSDTAATLTVLQIDETFPLSRTGRTRIEDETLQLGRLEAWRRVLEESRASVLEDMQKAAILSLTSSASSHQLHTYGVDRLLEAGDTSGLAEIIEAMSRASDDRLPSARISIQRRRLVERALFEMPERGRGAGALIAAFPEMAGVTEPPDRIRLAAMLNQARSAVADCSPSPLNANQMEALASFAVSIGVPSFTSSSVCRHLGDGNRLAVAREIAYSSFEFEAGRIVHNEALMRRRAYETALFLAVTEGAARDRLHEVRLARALEAQGISVSATASIEEMQEAATPQLETLSADARVVAEAFERQDGRRAAAYFIRMFEGLETRAYQDQVGVWTIGFGTTGDWVQPGSEITPAEASRYLTNYIDEDWRYLSEAFQGELPPQEQAAILSLSYNVGRGRVAQSTLVRVLNEGDIEGAADHFLDWNKARIDGELVVIPGLDRRRHAERALFEIDASDQIAETIIAENFSLIETPQALEDGLVVGGYGEVGPDGSFPRRLDAEAARERLRTNLDEMRAEVSNALDRPIDPLQLEAMTILAYAVGFERFERMPILNYINEGNTQAALAAIGYWDIEARGPGGYNIENYAELRSNAAALFAMGYRL